MFYAKQNGQASDPEGFVARAKDIGASTGQTVGTAAQTAYVAVSKGVRQGVYAVRVWAAPRLETAADYHTTTVAPKVSSALLVTAQRVRPEDVTKKKGRSALTWTLLAAAVVAAMGAVGALVRYRYQATMTTDIEEEDLTVGPAGSETAAAAGAAAASPAADPSQTDSAATSTDAGADGRVSTSGW